MNKITLALVDDHPMVLLGIQLSLEKKKIRHIEINGAFVSGTEILNNIDNIITDVVMVDLLLPDMKGSELIAKLLVRKPSLKIGIFSSYDDEEEILSSFANGALGYLSKSAKTDEMIHFVETIYQGEIYIKDRIAEILINHTKLTTGNNIHFQLTLREQEVLDLILDGEKNKAIANKLYISERTVEFHRKNIFVKFNVTNISGLMKSVYHYKPLAGQLHFW